MTMVRAASKRQTPATRLAAVVLSAVVVPALVLVTGHAADPPVFSTGLKATGVGGYEPGIDIAPDGTIFVNGPRGSDSLHSALSRKLTTDATFKELNFGTMERLPGGFDSDLVVAPGLNPGDPNRLYFLDLWVGSDSVAVSEDNGSTWAYGQPLTTLPASDRQWISVGKRNPLTGKDTLYAIYHFIQPPSTVMFARSEDGGLTWPFHRALPTPVGGAAGSPGNLISNGDFVGFIHMTGNGNVQVSYSNDGGLVTWNTKTINTFGDGCCNIPSVAMDGDDFYGVWLSNDFSVHVSRSIDGAGDWDEFSVNGFSAISAPDTSNVFPWIAARNGKVAVAWYSTAPTGTNLDPNNQTGGRWKLMYAESLDQGVTWSAPVCASCYDKLEGVVKHGIVCTAGLGCDLGTDAPGGRELGDFLQIEIGADNKSIITYGDIRVGGSPAKIIRQL